MQADEVKFVATVLKNINAGLTFSCAVRAAMIDRQIAQLLKELR